MKTYYWKDENNIIQIVSNEPFENCLETDEQIIVDYRGCYVLLSETLQTDYIVEKSKAIKCAKIQKEILELKQNLLNTDFKAIKFSEGEISEEEFNPIRLQRREWRNRINELEKELNE